MPAVSIVLTVSSVPVVPDQELIKEKNEQVQYKELR